MLPHAWFYIHQFFFRQVVCTRSWVLRKCMISLPQAFPFTERVLDKKKERKKNAAFERYAKKVDVVSFLANWRKSVVMKYVCMFKIIWKKTHYWWKCSGQAIFPVLVCEKPSLQSLPDLQSTRFRRPQYLSFCKKVSRMQWYEIIWSNSGSLRCRFALQTARLQNWITLPHIAL